MVKDSNGSDKNIFVYSLEIYSSFYSLFMQFLLVSPCVARIALYPPDRAVSSDKMEEMKILFLEEEIKELKSSLRDEKCRNHYLTNLIGMAEQQKTLKQ